MTLFEMLDDRELAEAIDRLSRQIEKVDRDASPIATVRGLHLQSALDEALDERDRRRMKEREA